MLRAPLFHDNEIPPLLLINDDMLTEKEERILHAMAIKLREAYMTYIELRNKQMPYLKALAIQENIKSKLSHTFIRRFL